MMREMFSAAVNSPATALVADISVSASTIDVVDGSVLPDAPNLLVINPSGDDAETVKMTAKNGNRLTVIRGFQGAAKAWEAETLIARNFTAYDHDTFIANINEIVGRLVPFVTASGTNNYTATLDGYQGHVAGLPIMVRFTNANTAASFLNINNLGNVSITRNTNVTLVSGDIRADSVHILVFDGTRFQLITQGFNLTTSQLNTVLTAYVVGANTPIVNTDTILQALGKLQGQVSARGTSNLQLTSPITGFTAGSNAAVVATDSILEALGKLQGQVSARGTSNLQLSSPITGFAVGANSAIAATDSILQALGKTQGQINALANSSNGNFVVERGSLTDAQFRDTRPGMSYAGLINSTIAAANGLPSGTFRIEFFPTSTTGWGMQRATGIGGTSARQVFLRTTSALDTWSAWNLISSAVRNLQTGQFIIPGGTNVSGTNQPLIPITTVAATARTLPVVYGGGVVNVTGQPAGHPTSQRVVLQECRMQNTSNIAVQLAPSLGGFFGTGTTLTALGALMRFHVLEHNV